MQAQQFAHSMPAFKQLVLVGGGHSHLSVISEFAMRPVPGLQVVLVSEDTMTGYSGMLPGLMAGHYSFEETHIDLRRLCQQSGVVFVQDRVEELSLETNTLRCAKRGDLRFDWLSINTGSTPVSSRIEDTEDRLIPVKPIKPFLAEIDRIILELESDDRPASLSIGVVGAGAAGVEVALSLQTRLKSQYPDFNLQFHLLSADSCILPTHNDRVRRCMEGILVGRGVALHKCFRVQQLALKSVIAESGETLDLDEVVLVTESSPQGWLKESGLSCTEQGFIEVNDYLQSVSHPSVFAVGDVAHMVNYQLEKAGVFAVRQGRPLALNLKNLILGKPLKPYRPQKKWLALISAGDQYAIASKGSFFAKGQWVWRWKDYIDRKFMKMYQTFNSMSDDVSYELPEPLRSNENNELAKNLSMRCTGCGSKVGASVLKGAIERLGQREGAGVSIGLGQADDAAIIDVPKGQSLVQSLDYFSAPLDDPYLVGQLASIHSLSDLHAMGATPHSALAMVTLPLASQSLMTQTLDQVLAGAAEVFEAEKIALVGGHTTEGNQLQVGFSVNGFVQKKAALKKQGIRPGDVLILTKALGSGILFAAHTQLKAKGVWIDSMLERMLQSNAAASKVFVDLEASACTDITGFGLMGHLAEMIKDQPLSLHLELDALLVYEGALALSHEGVQSTLYPENLKARHFIANLDSVSERERFPLLFDPQTAGGLLASVPAHRLDECLNALHLAGVDGVCLGTSSEATSGPEVIWT